MSVNLVKLTCTKPLPPDAKIVIKKGKKYAKLQKSGRDVECPVNGKGDRIQLQSSSWYAEWWDSNKKRCRKKLCTNREAAKVMLGELVSKLDRQAAGITDPFESHRRRPIADHLEDFHSYLTAKERAAKHVAETRKQIEAIIEGCKIKLLGDVSATQIQAFLAELRTDKKTPTLPAEDWIEVESAAQILDISRTFLSRQVERYQFARRIEKRKAYLRRDDIATEAI